ncbi:MAG: pyridoxal phosphate-dependent aminotransferase family protein [Planctomycetaceae bacterium]|nr:pyridoxal phosphate-dependent aminotransferase family protein [Planctomycetaceae bacterium]
MPHFTLYDAPERNISVPKTAAQAAIEETFSFDGPPDAMITIAGKVYLYFAGSGYLGLQANPEVLAATCESVLHYGVGTATSRTAFTSPPVFEVERRIAEMFGTEHALYTASGYAANLMMLESLEKTFDRIFIDEASHYSLFESAKRIRKKRCIPITFRHRDTDDLKKKLDANLQLHERPIVLTDGVFAQHGTAAPLNEYTVLLAGYAGASLWVDDAHGFGILGNTGRGTLEHFGLDASAVNQTPDDWNGDWETDDTVYSAAIPLYLTFSLSKAAGGCGGVIPGSAAFIQRLKDHSSVYFAASAPPTPIAAATAKSLAILAESNLRQRLHKNVTLIKSKLRSIGLDIPDTLYSAALPAVILTLGAAANMKRIQKELSQRGILIAYLPRNIALGSQGALRIAVFATHTEAMITELVETLAKTL